MRKLKRKKRILSAVMTVCMMCSVLVGVEPLKVSAASAAKYEHLTISSGFNADVVATTTRAVVNKLVNGRTTFQGAFMSGELTAKGDFKTLRMFDQLFRFDKI
jgi:hypothetical protein